MISAKCSSTNTFPSKNDDEGSKSNQTRPKRRNFAMLNLAAVACVLLLGVSFGDAKGLEVQASRRLQERAVNDMTSLFNKVSNYDGKYADVVGNDIIEPKDTVKLRVGEYKCNDAGDNCSGSGLTTSVGHSMIVTSDLPGTIKCEKDDASSCILNGENKRRIWFVSGYLGGYSDGAATTFRAITFFQGSTKEIPVDKDAFGNNIEGWRKRGGGLSVKCGAVVKIELCVFDSCTAPKMGTEVDRKGGAIYVENDSDHCSAGITLKATRVNVYATSFQNNKAEKDDGKATNGGDIYIMGTGGDFTFHDTCASPYEDNEPVEGKKKDDFGA